MAVRRLRNAVIFSSSCAVRHLEERASNSRGERHTCWPRESAARWGGLQLAADKEVALLLRTQPDAFDPGRRRLAWRRRVYSRGQGTTEHGGESAAPPAPRLQGRGAQQGSLSLALRCAPPQRLEATEVGSDGSVRRTTPRLPQNQQCHHQAVTTTRPSTAAPIGAAYSSQWSRCRRS